MLCCYALAKIQVHTLARWRATRLFTNLFGVLALVNFGHRSCFFTTNLVICEVQQMISCSDTADGCGGGNPVDGYSPLGWNGYIPRNDRMTRELGITWHQVASLISPLLWLESLVERSARSMEGLGACQNPGKCGKRIITVFFKGPLLPFTVHSCSVWAGPKESL